MTSKKDKPSGPQAEAIADANRHQQELAKLKGNTGSHQGAGQPGSGNQGGGGHMSGSHGSGAHMSSQGGGSHSAERGEKHPQRNKGK